MPLAAAAPPTAARARGGPSRERGVGAPGRCSSGLKGPQNLLDPSPESAPALRSQHSARLCCRAAAAATPRRAAPALPAAATACSLRCRRRCLPPTAARARGVPSRMRGVGAPADGDVGIKGLKTCWISAPEVGVPAPRVPLGTPLRRTPRRRAAAAAPPLPRRRCRATAATPPLPRRRATADAPRAPSSQRRCIGVTAHTITRAPPPNTITSQRHRPHTHAEPARRSPSASI